MIRRRLLSTAIVSVLMIGPAAAQTGNVLQILDGSGPPGSVGNSVLVNLANPTQGPAGVQLEIKHIPLLLTVSDVLATERSQDMDLSYVVAGDSLRVVLLFLDLDTIPAGDGPILEILYDVDSEATEDVQLEIVKGLLADSDAAPMDVTLIDGIFDVIITGVADEEPGPPTDFILTQNYPNPFNDATVISYALPSPNDVEILLYDVRGHVVRRWWIPGDEAGWHEVKWAGRDGSGQPLASGVYIYRLTAGAFQEARKAVYLK